MPYLLWRQYWIFWVGWIEWIGWVGWIIVRTIWSTHHWLCFILVLSALLKTLGHGTATKIREALPTDYPASFKRHIHEGRQRIQPVRYSQRQGLFSPCLCNCEDGSTEKGRSIREHCCINASQISTALIINNYGVKQFDMESSHPRGIPPGGRASRPPYLLAG
jgi:hypothetical protein